MNKYVLRPLKPTTVFVNHPNEEEEMKLSLFFTLIDLLIVFAYPFVYIWGKMHSSMKDKTRS